MYFVSVTSLPSKYLKNSVKTYEKINYFTFKNALYTIDE